MITCCIDYKIDPYKVIEFEKLAKMWIPLVEKFGGKHHGYFLPSEGDHSKAYSLFSFNSLAEYEEYRKKSFEDDECKVAFEYAEQTRCIINFKRSFLRPVFS